MKIVVIDPGVSTGVIVYDSERKCIERHRTFQPVGRSALLAYLEKSRPDLIIMEGKPKNDDWDDSLRNFYGDVLCLRSLRIRIKLITPGFWKPVAKVKEWKLAGVSVHENDAYCILRFYCMTNHRELKDAEFRVC